jgi:hypothetical protein
MSRFGRCIHCREPLDSPDFRSCSRCCQLLRELGDTVVEPPPAREPGCDDIRESKRPARHDGRWLAWAADKKGKTRWFHHYGRSRGFPGDLRRWSPGMVAQAIEAIQKEKTPAR